MTTRDVELSGGAPWGFRMHGGLDQNQPLRISRQRYSDSLEKLLDVNPGRKASLSGIREGDVITSINGRPTKSMSNAEAHAMLRNAGPVLKLGLNEDRVTSPCRKSIGKTSSELKRPSQLIAEAEAVPQAPVYATIRPSQSPHKNSPSPMKTSVHSLQSCYTTGSPTFVDQSTQFHPTNPFYSTLPSNNYQSASKLPISNGTAYPYLSLDRSRPVSKAKDMPFLNNQYNSLTELLVNDFASNNHTAINTNGYEHSNSSFGNKSKQQIGTGTPKKHVEFSADQNDCSKSNNERLNVNENPFEKYLRQMEDESSNQFVNSMTDEDYRSTKEEVIRRSTVTEHKVDSTEEIKTIKKIILNGSGDKLGQPRMEQDSNKNTKVPDFPGKPRSTSPAAPLTPSFSLPRSPVAPATSPASTPTSANRQTVMIAPKFKARSTSPAVWRPGAPTPPPAPRSPAPRSPAGAAPPPPPLPVWTPGSAGASPVASRRSFRPVHFEDTPPARRKLTIADLPHENGCASGSESEGRLRTSHSAPATGLNRLGESGTASRLPKAQNPTVTLLQKAREGQLARGPNYLQDRESARLPRDRVTPPRSDPVHALRREYASEGEAERREHQHAGIRKMADAQKKVDGIGPITKDGMPVALRSEVKDQARWYKKMYDTIHKNKYDDDYVTIRYKNRGGQPGVQRVTGNKSQYAYFDPRSGYLSEPEGGLSRLGSSAWSDAYDSDATYGPRRRTASVQEASRHQEEILSPYLPSNKYSTLASARASQEIYKNQPGRIENYVPGKSSVVDKEAKQWWDEVMDIFDGWLDENSPLPPYGTLLARAIQKSQLSSTTSLPQASPKEKKDITSAILSKSNMARALKESGYESDSTLVFRRRDDTDGPLSPAERRAAYRDLQAGGEPPLRGFRSPAPPRQDDSEIEYIPISPTLTKIRIHKKIHNTEDQICYTSRHKLQSNTKRHKVMKTTSSSLEYPPAPPRRLSSRNSRTLKLVTSKKSKVSPIRTFKENEQSNIDYLKDKLHNKLTRQNTQTIITGKKMEPKIVPNAAMKSKRFTSISSPPAIDRKSSFSSTKTNKNTKKAIDSKCKGTSSFSSPRRTILPTEYTSQIYSKYEDNHNTRIVIEGGVGRKTPITNILDRVTSLDKLWSSEKRYDTLVVIPKKHSNTFFNSECVQSTSKPSIKSTNGIINRGRDMIRTSDKLQKLRTPNSSSTPCLASKLSPKGANQQTALSYSNLKKSLPNSQSSSMKQQTVKTAIVTNLKNKKSIENLNTRSRGMPCHSSCNKKTKELEVTPKNKGHTISRSISGKLDTECSSQFGDIDETCIEHTALRLTKLKEQRDAIISDNFFQSLFLRNNSITILPVETLTEQNTSVLQKAKMFQSIPQDYNASRSLNSYLIHRKPVSQSRFKVWDRYSGPDTLPNSRSISWPGRMHSDIRKFDSLNSECENFGSVTSLNTIRSKSEPPFNKIFFSQTSRPISPTVIFHKKEKIKSPLDSDLKSQSKLILTETSRPISPKVIHKSVIKARENSSSPSKSIINDTYRQESPGTLNIKCNKITKGQKIIFLPNSRSVSPNFFQKRPYSTHSTLSRSQSTSPVSIRSPSYRRIHSVRMQGYKYDAGQLNKIVRTRSAGDADQASSDKTANLKASSENLLHYINDPDYDEYLSDIENDKMRTNRFRELNRYYSYLERVGELEKATSACNLRHRRKDEEIIDFDRWKKIRSIERAEEELNNLYSKLRVAQIEKDVLFYPRDVTDFRWNFDKERNLRIKEKSVEDLKEVFQQKSTPDENLSCGIEYPIFKDTYKPLWRGTSVAETAFNINHIKDKNVVSKLFQNQPKISIQQDQSLGDLRKKLGLGSRLWSSLSMDQVNALKNQLNAIYSKDAQLKVNKPIENDNDKYSIQVTENMQGNPSLQVRSNSLIAYGKKYSKENEMSKSDSIAAINSFQTTEENLKNNVSRSQMSLSECEKKRISQTLSKEVLNRMKKYDNHLSDEDQTQCQEIKNEKDDNKRNMDKSKIENENKIILTEQKAETTYLSSTSETDTVSSDISGRTVIYKGPSSKEVQKKVEYFESVKSTADPLKTVYHAREDSDDKYKNENMKTIPIDVKKKENKDKHIMKQSQSCTNLKELFGETDKNIYLSLPPKSGRYSRSPSPQTEIYVDDRRTPDTLRYSSNETICRSRSASPDAEHYWRAYLNLMRAGEVKRIARRFDSPPTTLRRHRSDPEIVRSILLSRWPSMEKYRDNIKRLKRTVSPVARVPLRPTNRFMPHIDIISKLAALRRRTTVRSRSADEVPECRPGEVDRIRRRFETMSVLGQIYASAPDVSELRDIAPYLTGPWVAHQYPRRRDNNITIDTGKIKVRTTPIRKDSKVKTLTKERTKPNSILKSDTPLRQVYNPAAHRPASRYEPPRPPPRPPPASWPYQMARFVTPHRHTVKFQETEWAPNPPRRAPSGSVSDTESPRRYVESDVNIHYRCPVRRDPLPLVPERELAKQQAEHMRRLYREQRRAKYLQELQDMQSRRHQDNFTPAQKTIVPLNRYDETDRTVARALYTFNGQTQRELSFRKGDIINVRRQVDANWYEGELQGRMGLFPYNYVEILKGDVAVSQKKPTIVEGRARAKFDFTAQTNLELPLKKGEIVVLTRRIDNNWWEGRRGTHTGIFPDSYVTILQEPTQNKPDIQSSEKPVGSPASHGLVNGSARRNMNSHVYTPQLNSPALSNAPPATQPLPGYLAKPAQATLTPSERGYGPPAGLGTDLNNTEPLFVDTNAEAVPYRAMYKYRPQNPDELELTEGDTVYVLEKCDDGWYVGSSQRTGRFGTFPGNYVERI